MTTMVYGDRHLAPRVQRRRASAKITGPDQVNAIIIAGRNHKLLNELAEDFAVAGNLEAVTAIREWQRRAKEMNRRPSLKAPSE